MDKSIFDDRESLLKIWLDERRSRDFQASLMWENIKYFSTLISALITVDVFFLRFIFGETSSQLNVNVPSLIFPFLIIAVSILGERELRRRWMRVLESITHIAKIESLIGLEQRLPNYPGRAFPEDEYLFQRWRKSHEKYNSSEEFIKGELKDYNMYSHMSKVYYVTSIMGVILLIFHLFPILSFF